MWSVRLSLRLFILKVLQSEFILRNPDLRPLGIAYKPETAVPSAVESQTNAENLHGRLESQNMTRELMALPRHVVNSAILEVRRMSQTLTRRL